MLTSFQYHNASDLIFCYFRIMHAQIDSGPWQLYIQVRFVRFYVDSDISASLSRVNVLGHISFCVHAYFFPLDYFVRVLI